MSRTEVAAVYPLTLTVNQDGGVTGLSPTAAVRRGTDYLDWADNTFKAAGWTTRKQVMTELGDGHYTLSLNLGTINAAPGDQLAIEYNTESAAVPGVTNETLTVARDTDLLRKLATNRIEEFAGNPGQLILFDDNGVTPLKTWQLRDGTGGATALSVGAPAKRSAAS
jgi:hypothetical protein